MTAQPTFDRFAPALPRISNARLWTGRILTGVALAFFLFDGAMKLVKPPVVVEGTLRLGYPESAILPIGIAALIYTLLYAIPRTAILGAVLLTGYLGGAVASNVRVQSGWFNTLFPIVFAAFIWGGLYLRDWRLETVFAPRRMK